MSVAQAQDRVIQHDPMAETRWLSYIGLGVLAALVVTMVVFCFVAKIEGAVISPGIVKVDLNKKEVQHQDGGIVKAVLVRDGQQVSQGDTLIELSDVGVDASVELLSTQLEGEQARKARLQAEKDFLPEVHFPPELMAQAHQPTVSQILTKERGLFTVRRQTLNSQIALMEAQIDEVKDEVDALDRQLAAERDAMKLQKDELALNQKLLDENFVQKTKVITLQRAVAEYEGRYGGDQAERAKSQQKINDLQLRIISQRNEYTETAARDLRESTNTLLDLEQKLRPSEDAKKRLRITAPASGEIVNLHVTSPGAVIGPRDVLAEIVPTHAKLVIEGHLRPQDITHAHIGAKVDVRLTAFTYRDTPVVQGLLTYVSGDAQTDRNSGTTFYTVLVEVSSEALKAAGDLYMQAGMPAEIFIKTDPRLVISYIGEPIMSYLNRSLREP